MFSSGSVLNKFLKRFLPTFDTGERLIFRMLLIPGITALPIVILSAIYGTLAGTTVDEPLLKDVETLTRLFVIIPFLLYVEKVIEQPLGSYLENAAKQIKAPDADRFFRFRLRFGKWSQSSLPEIVLFILIYIFTLSLTGRMADPGSTSWVYRTTSIEELQFTVAGRYFALVSLPLYQFVFIRWLWRWLLWVGSLISLSRMNWNLNAMHGDRMGGLEFLNGMPFIFSISALSLSMNLSTMIYEEIRDGAVTLLDYKFTITGFVILVAILCFLPLVSFIPKLLRLRSNAIEKFGALIQFHHNHFEAKWFSKSESEVESILGSTDPSSLADINGGYEAVQSMRIVPINYKLLLFAMLLLSIPFIPLLFTSYSFLEIFSLLIKALG